MVRRISELAYIKGRPVALLGWINLGGVRTPLYVCELEPAKLHETSERGVFRYLDLTSDPRLFGLEFTSLSGETNSKLQFFVQMLLHGQ